MRFFQLFELLTSLALVSETQTYCQASVLVMPADLHIKLSAIMASYISRSVSMLLTRTQFSKDWVRVLFYPETAV